MKIIRKLICLLAITLFTGLVDAQKNPSKEEAEKDVKKDIKTLKKEREERNKDISKANLKAASKKQGKIRKTRKHLHATKKHLKNKGEDEPIKKAKDEMDNEKQ